MTAPLRRARQLRARAPVRLEVVALLAGTLSKRVEPVVSPEKQTRRSAGRTVLIVVNTEADAIVSYETGTRCHSLLQSGVDAKGDRYFAADGYAVSTHLMAPELAPGPCMLRLRAGETSLDPDWSRDFSDELGTRLWTGVTQGKNQLFIQSIAGDNPGVLAGLEPAAVSAHSRRASAGEPECPRALLGRTQGVALAIDHGQAFRALGVDG
jgi:hypothetical protein